MIRRRSGLGTSAGDADFLQAALLGYEQQRSEIQGRIAELRRQLGRHGADNGSVEVSGSGAAQPATRRVLSAAARQRIADAQRKRWAAFRKHSAQAKPTARAAKPKMSAAAKKRIGDAARKRWAAFRAKKAQAAAPPKVKTAGA